MKLRWICIVLCTILVGMPGLPAQSGPAYKDAKVPLEARVNDLMKRLTQDEKLSLLSGTAFTTQPISRLSIPPIAMVDAGQGVRGGMDSTQGPATLFPSGIAMASTWDPALVGRIGQAIGEEALNKGTGSQVLLGPDVNIHRSPLAGRNGEAFSEDPYLTARLAVGYIQGMQSTGCAACIKHFACNNEEADRNTVNVKVSERALREIYLPAFEAGVKEGHVWTLMAAYNQINGHYATANEYLLKEVLKKGWGFDGMVMSDWGAVHQTVGVVNAGNDLEMPGPGFLAPDKVAAAMTAGRIAQATLDENVRRILRTIIRVGLLDGPKLPDNAVVNSPAHQRLTLEAATDALVLLKNQDGILPFDASKLRSIAVIGPAAVAMQLGAHGSPSVTPFYSVSPLDGIKKRVGNAVTVNYAVGTETGTPVPATALQSGDPQAGSGLLAQYFPNRTLDGPPTLTRTDAKVQFNWGTGRPAASLPTTDWSVRWTGKLVAPVTGHYVLILTADDGSRLFLNGKVIIDHWEEGAALPQTVQVDLIAGHAYDLRIEYFQAAGEASAQFNWIVPGQPRFAEAVTAAGRSDVAVVCVGTSGTESEGTDRPSMALPGDQDALIQAVAAANKHTVVVLNNGTPVLMQNWLGQVPGLIEAWFPGQEGGNAIAAVLFGDANPSGKLPDTMGVRREDYPDFGHFPGIKGAVDYAEGIYVGYRHFDKAKIAPVFPFGYGLSYTTFRYDHLRLSAPVRGVVTVHVDVTNTGRRAGAEVAELYVHDPAPKIDRPVRELKGFRKVSLAPGQTKTVVLTLTPRDLSYCDVSGKQWKADAGDYDVELGSSSRDIRQQAQMHLASNYAEPILFLGEHTATHDASDLAYGQPVLASSVQQEGLEPENAVDGNDDSRWSSQFSDPQWIAVNIGKAQRVNRVRLTWEEAYAASYQIQVSLDGKTWANVFHTDTGHGDIEDIHFTPVTARWVRIYGTKRAREYGYSLFSFEVFAPEL